MADEITPVVTEELAPTAAELEARLKEQAEIIEQLKAAQSGSDKKVAELLREKQELEARKIEAAEADLSKEEIVAKKIESLEQSIEAERLRVAQAERRQMELEAYTAAGLDTTLLEIEKISDPIVRAVKFKEYLGKQSENKISEIRKSLGSVPETGKEPGQALDDLELRLKKARETKNTALAVHLQDQILKTAMRK